MARAKYAARQRPAVDALVNVIDHMELRPAPWTGRRTKEVLDRCPAPVAVNAGIDYDSDAEQDWRGIFTDDEVLDVYPKLNLSLITFSEGGPGSFFYAKDVTLAEARGRILNIAPRVIEMTFGGFRESDLTGWCGTTYLGIYPGRRYRDITNTGVESREERYSRLTDQDEFLAQRARFIAGYAITDEYDWHVVIGHKSSPKKVSIPTSGRGCLELLALRDVPDGAKRRAALRHWVSGHTRKISEDEETEVRAHLRGRIPFQWDEYSGYVEPSAYVKRAVEAERLAAATRNRPATRYRRYRKAGQ